MKKYINLTLISAIIFASNVFSKTLDELVDQYPMGNAEASKEYIIANANDFAKEFNKWKDTNVAKYPRSDSRNKEITTEQAKRNAKIFRVFAHYYALYAPVCADVLGIQLSAPIWCVKSSTPSKLKQLRDSKYVIDGVKLSDIKILMLGIYSNNIDILNDSNLDNVPLEVVERFLPNLKVCLLKSTDNIKAYDVYCKIETKLCIGESSKLEGFTIIRSILLNRKLVNN